MKIDVQIDNNKCLNPIECGKCMRVCPVTAFRTYPSEKREKGKIHDNWLLTCFNFECVGCGRCEQICPVRAVTLNLA